MAAAVESTLATGSDKIRQFAFDGDDATYFASEARPGAEDSFTLTFDAPVAVKSVAVRAGKPGVPDALGTGSLEGSEDGTSFRALAPFRKGEARAEPGRTLKAIRIRPGADARGAADPPARSSSTPTRRWRHSPTPSSTPSTSPTPPR